MGVRQFIWRSSSIALRCARRDWYFMAGLQIYLSPNPIGTKSAGSTNISRTRWNRAATHDHVGVPAFDASLGASLPPSVVGVAAIKAGKIFTGIEHNPKHFDTAVRRLTEALENSQREAA